jgi:hypothetical protein
MAHPKRNDGDIGVSSRLRGDMVVKNCGKAQKEKALSRRKGLCYQLVAGARFELTTFRL